MCACQPMRHRERCYGVNLKWCLKTGGCDGEAEPAQGYAINAWEQQKQEALAIALAGFIWVSR